MKTYHRKTLIKNESWPLVDGWYWCPLICIEKRIEEEKERLSGFLHASSISYGLLRWSDDQKRLDARLAHACHDGKIRAPSGYGIEYYQKVGGIAKIYGKCRHCDEELSDGIKTIIFMEKMGT